MQDLRVLLLEDDPAVRLFLQMALEPLSLNLVPCATLAQARQALADPDVRLVLTDLSLPDGSGLELLQWANERTRSTGVPCRTVVFSGGVDPATEQKLQALQVWRVLSKPASVGSLMACVSEALAADAGAGQPPPPPAQTDPLNEFFGGNRALYDAYRVTSLVQLARDLEDGDRAVGAGDWEALRRVAHNLKSALTLLGQAAAAQEARATEEHAAQSANAQAQAGWTRLCLQVRAFVAQNGPGG